jgi:YVTN family beta-propeller protein
MSLRRRAATPYLVQKLAALIGPTLLVARVVGAEPTGYVANYGSDDVTIVDAGIHTAIDTLATGAFPRAVFFSPLGRFAYVANSGDPDDPEPDTLSVIEVRTGNPVADIDAGDSPVDIASTPDGRLLFIANAGRTSMSDGTLSIVDMEVVLADAEADPVVATVETGGDPGGVGVSPDGRFAYVTNHVLFERNVVFVVDVELALTQPELAVVDEIPVGNSPLGIAVTPDGRRAYVANFAFGSNAVSVLDLENQTFLQNVAVGSRPADVAVSPDGRFIYASNFISDTVSVIDTATNRVRSTIGVGLAPQGLAFSPDGTFVYVANRQSIDIPTPGTVSVIDTARALSGPSGAVIEEIDVGHNPVAAAVAADALRALLSGFFVEVGPVDGDLNRDQRVSAADLPALLTERGS